jgi:hypothetical protein
MLAHLREVIDVSNPAIARVMNEGRRLICWTSSELRTASYLLHPPNLDHLEVTFPPTNVSTDCVFGNSGGGTAKMSCDKTARSANFPGSRLPFPFPRIRQRQW